MNGDNGTAEEGQKGIKKGLGQFPAGDNGGKHCEKRKERRMRLDLGPQETILIPPRLFHPSSSRRKLFLSSYSHYCLREPCSLLYCSSHHYQRSPFFFFLLSATRNHIHSAQQQQQQQQESQQKHWTCIRSECN